VAIFSKDETAGKQQGRASNTETSLSIIAAGTTVSGDIACGGVLKVEGRIEGSVLEARQVMLAKQGGIQGNVNAHEVVVGGVIDGDVTATDRLELQSSAVVNGEINTKSIVVMEGARINGGVRMTEIALVSGQADGRSSREPREARLGR
jgi:cytoskeletal protein CcmA (bactofilin family)